MPKFSSLAKNTNRFILSGWEWLFANFCGVTARNLVSFRPSRYGFLFWGASRRIRGVFFRTFESRYSSQVVLCHLAEKVEVDLRIILAAIVLTESNLYLLRMKKWAFGSVFFFCFKFVRDLFLSIYLVGVWVYRRINFLYGVALSFRNFYRKNTDSIFLGESMAMR